LINVDTSGAAWKVARNCGQASCVQVASLPAAIAMRDSKDPTGPVLTYPRAAWLDFVSQAKLGVFDAHR
jgi:hypothetical protein